MNVATFKPVPDDAEALPKPREYVVTPWCFLNTALVFAVALGGGIGIGWAVRDDGCTEYMASTILFPPGTKGAIHHTGLGGGHVAVIGATVDPHSCEGKLHASLVAAGKTIPTTATHSSERRALDLKEDAKNIFGTIHPVATYGQCLYTTDTTKTNGDPYDPVESWSNKNSGNAYWGSDTIGTQHGHVLINFLPIAHGEFGGEKVFCDKITTTNNFPFLCECNCRSTAKQHRWRYKEISRDSKYHLECAPSGVALASGWHWLADA
jgi:hypothetical protein